MAEQEKSRNPKIILVVAVAALAISLGYQWWASREGEAPVQGRPVSSFLVNWECLACKNREEGRAGAGPHKCAKCGKNEAYPVISWACRTHGPQPVFFQYTAEGKPSQVMVGPGGKWGPAFNEAGNFNIKCPQCGSPMVPAEVSKPADDDGPLPAQKSH